MRRASSPCIHKVEILHTRPLLKPPLSLLRLDAENSEKSTPSHSKQPFVFIFRLLSMTLNYKEFGQGYPVIILHGLFGTLDNWQTIAKQLAADYSVYIIDQRNHGKSPHDDAFDYSIMAEDLKDFMESQWIHEAHIIGHSMGGKAVMQFAKEYPDMVSKLVVVDIAPVQNPVRHTHIFEALNALPLAKLIALGSASFY